MSDTHSGTCRPRLSTVLARFVALSLCCVGFGCAPLENPPLSDTDLTPSPDMDIDLAEDLDQGRHFQTMIGESCAGPLDCIANSLCVGSQREDPFLCMAECELPNSICADGSVCMSITSDQTAICYIGGERPINETCDSNLQCEPGALCFGDPQSDELPPICRPACTEWSESCGETEYCQPTGSSSLCRSKLGAGCSDSTECPQATLTCSTDISPELEGYFPGGVCTLSCSSDTECADSGGVCRRVFSSEQSICLQECEHDGDCRYYEGYRCFDQTICEGRVDEEVCSETFGSNRLCAQSIMH